MPQPSELLAAPMEGLTDEVWRRAHHDIFGGIDEYCTPFQRLTWTRALSAREKRDLDPELNRGLTVLPQALTRDKEQLADYLRLVQSLGYTEGNWNLGCPSPTVTKRGRGAALLKAPDTVREILAFVVAENTLPLSVKARLGLEDVSEWEAILPVLTEAGLSRLILHPRTAREGYNGPIHPEAFEQALKAFGARAVWSGDVRSTEDLAALYARFGQIPVMIGRGLLRDPALARRARGGQSASRDEWRALLTALLDRYAAFLSLPIALGKLKQILIYPLGGQETLPLFRPFRKANTRDAFLAALDRFCASSLFFDEGGFQLDRPAGGFAPPGALAAALR